MSDLGRTTIESPEEERLWRDAMDAKDKGHIALACEYCRRYTNEYPLNVWGWVSLAATLGDLARFKDARRAFGHALRIAPLSARSAIFRQVGTMYTHAGNHNRALLWVRRAVRLEPSTAAWILVGAVLAKLGRFEDAKTCHRNAIACGSAHVDEAYFNLGLILRAEGLYEEALDAFTESINLDPQYRIAKIAKRDVAAALRTRESGRSDLP